jgi:lysophospholipase L1-like esterase
MFSPLTGGRRMICVAVIPMAICAIGLLVAARMEGQTLRIMPLGDSITRGNNDINFPNGDVPGGYRKELGQRLDDAGFAVDFVGSRNDNAAAGMDPDHEGEPGARTDEILANFSNYAGMAPDTVLLMAGTNDILQNVPIATAADHLEDLIQAITLGFPARKLYVATIPPITQAWPTQNPQYSAAYLNAQADLYNIEVRNLVQQHASEGRNVSLVDMNAQIVLTHPDPANNFYQPGDGVHPGAAGYDQLGLLWFNALTAGPPPAGLPAMPGNLAVTVASPSRVNLTWTDLANNEARYQIRRRVGVTGIWEIIATVPANSTSHVITGLLNGIHSYGFSVRAINGSGGSEWTAPASTPDPGDKAHLKTATATSSFSTSFQAPKANDGLTTTRWASNGGGAQHWSVDLASQHHIQRVNVVTPQDANAEAHRRNFEIRASNDPAFASYTVLGGQGAIALPHQATFTLDVTNPMAFRHVRVAKTDGTSFAMALVKVHGVPAVSAPAAPSALTVEALDSLNVRLVWDANSINENGFTLERQVGAGGSFAPHAEIHAAGEVYQDRAILPSTFYAYRLRAFNEAGNSSYSNVASVTTGSQTAYEIWAANFPAFLALPEAQRLPGADANGDGTSNLLAYALALDPMQAGSLPMVDVVPAPVFQFRRNKVAPNLDYEVLVASDPGTSSWDTLDLGAATVTDLGGSPAAELVSVPLPAGPGIPKQFVRLKVAEIVLEE